jgi:type I restriction enzyme R subunit
MVPEMVALADVIEKIKDLFSGGHPDSSVHSVVTHVTDRLEDSHTLSGRTDNHGLGWAVQSARRAAC